MFDMLETREIFLIVREQNAFLVIGSHTLYVDRMLHPPRPTFGIALGLLL